MTIPPPAPETHARRLAAKRALHLPQDTLLAECDEEFFTSGGPGGQHRNKTESGVRLTHRPTEVSVTATERRSQAQNRSHALERLREALAELLVIPKRRRATRPTRSSQRRRLDEKKRHSEKKSQRRGET